MAAELLAAGVDGLLVDDASSAGDADSARSRRTVEDAAALDPLTIYGLPGGAPGCVPAMKLTGSVLSVKGLLRGEGVSYGLTFRAPSDTRIALVTGGYAQGVVRALGNNAAVTLGGEPAKIVGRVAMDVCVVEIGARRVARGDEVVFFGDPRRAEPSIADWVTATGLSAAELVTTVGLRATRRVVA